MKKQMIKFFSILILASILLSGCGGKGDVADTSTETETGVVESETTLATEESTESAPKDETSEEEPEPPVRIADVLDPADCEPERNIKTFQDIASFLGRRINEWNKFYRKVELTENDRSAVLEYIDLLINEFDYEITGTYQFNLNKDKPFGEHFLDGTWEVCLSLSTVDTGREVRGRVTEEPCDMYLYCRKGELNLRFTDLFHTEDFGYRWSGNKKDRLNEVYGQRVLDAYWLENGRYHNESDGVLSVEAGTHGEAIVLINGEKVQYTTDAIVAHEVYADYPNDDYIIRIQDFLDGVEDEIIRVTVPKTLRGGEVYTISDGLAVRGDSPIWAIYNPGEGTVVRSNEEPTPRAGMNACTVRVLKWDEVECLVYISMDIVTELDPMTIEVLAAMPAYGSLFGDTFKEEEAVTLKVGETLELKYNPPYVFMPNYETYEWKLVSGQGAAIAGVGDTCTVTAVSEGQIVIKCVYSYGEDEPDVLTGIPRNENHTKTKLYYINIVP